MTTAIFVFFFGLAIAFLAFVFAAVNMTTRNDEALFGRHIGAMIGMAGGGLLSLIGIVVFILELLKANGWM